jgi:hypothetical protein
VSAITVQLLLSLLFCFFFVAWFCCFCCCCCFCFCCFVVFVIVVVVVSCSTQIIPTQCSYYKISDAERRHRCQVKLSQEEADRYRELLEERSTSIGQADALRRSDTAQGVRHLHSTIDGRWEAERAADIDLERRIKLQRAKRRRSVEQRFVNRLEALAPLGGQPVFIRGDWAGRQTPRGTVGGGRLGASFDKLLDRRQIVLVVDEAFTSKKCCFCGNDVRLATAGDVGVSPLFEKGAAW